MVLILFTKGSRFYDLKNKLDKVRAKKAKLTAIALFFGLFSATAQTHQHEHSHSQETDTTAVAHQHAKPTAEQVEKVIMENAVALEHADKRSEERRVGKECRCRWWR